jgi:hypothetical protein
MKLMEAVAKQFEMGVSGRHVPGSLLLRPHSSGQTIPTGSSRSLATTRHEIGFVGSSSSSRKTCELSVSQEPTSAIPDALTQHQHAKHSLDSWFTVKASQSHTSALLPLHVSDVSFQRAAGSLSWLYRQEVSDCGCCVTGLQFSKRVL